MKKEYRIRKVYQNELTSGNVWDNISGINIDCYPWNKNNYMPHVDVKMFYSNTHFHILFKAFEKEIKATYLSLNDPVYKDSCVEFFFNPKPEQDNRYMNFEVNPLGTLLLSVGSGRSDRIRLSDEPLEQFSILHSVRQEDSQSYDREYWSIEYSIPINFIEKYYGKTEFTPGYKILANFYKCGDETKFPHYGCWSPILNKEPDFHRPEYFGTILMY